VLHLRFDEPDGCRDLVIRRRGDVREALLDESPLDLDVLSVGPGEADFVLDGRRRRAWIAGRGDRRHVFLDGRVVTLHLFSEEGDAAADESAGGPRIVAPMPGKVVRVLVDVGAAVDRGEPLLLFEAMKMETEIAAPVAGRVAAIRCAAGRAAGLGDLLIEIEPGEGSAAPPEPENGE